MDISLALLRLDYTNKHRLKEITGFRLRRGEEEYSLKILNEFDRLRFSKEVL
jgi:hypothetical protein